MNRYIRTLAVVCALSLIAAGCGSGDDAATEASTTSTTTTSTTTTSTSTTTSVPEIAPSTDPDVEADTGPTYPLTGEPIGDAESPDYPAVVVKISNNDATARAALLGLDQADIIFEERIEQSATRFATVFHSSLPTEVGSVRSGRTSDVQIVSNLNNPVFAFSGANTGVHNQLRAAQNNGLLVRASADFDDFQFKRIPLFRPPDNLVVDVEALLSMVSEDAPPPDPLFDYSGNASELGVEALGVRVRAASPASYVWSEPDGGYLRYQGLAPHVTRDGVQITPTNVVILTTTYLASSIDSSSVDAVTIGSGPVEIYSDGYVVSGTWTREFARDPYSFETDDGEPIGLMPGQTWVSLAPAGTGESLDSDQIDELG